MHDAAYLHIRSRDGRATRIVPLVEPSVRIGRGRSCEVRLDEPMLAEVECLLRRRGDSWHLQPVQSAGRLTIDGRAADRPRPLPMGTTLRLLDRWLTLLPTDEAPDLDDDPTPVPAADDPSPEPAGEPSASRPDSFDGREEELARWEARLKQREQWLQDRQHERAWEARWRAAGAMLKGRARSGGEAAPRPRPATRPAVAPDRPIRPRREVPPPVAEAPASPRIERPIPTYRPPSPPPIRPVAPRPSRPDARGPEAKAPPPSPPPVTRALRVTAEVVPPEPFPPGRISLEEAPPSAASTVIEIEPEAAVPDDPIGLDLGERLEARPTAVPEAVPESESPPTDLGLDEAEPIEAEVVAVAPEIPGPIEAVEAPGPEPLGAGHPAPGPVAESVDPSGSSEEQARAVDQLEESAPTPEAIGEYPEGGTTPGPGGRAASWLSLPTIGLNDLVAFLKPKATPAEDAGAAEVGGGPTEGPAESGDPPPESVGPGPEPRRELELELPPGEPAEKEPAEDERADRAPDPIEGPVRPAGRAGEWPSARAILGAQPIVERPKPAGRSKRVAAVPMPTARVAPDEWTIPGGAWLCIPMMFVALAAGVAGVKLAWTWAAIGREAGRIADRLAGGRRPDPGVLELLLEREQDLPNASWWTGTADQMIVRAALLAGPETSHDPASQERAGALIHAAGAASPAHPGLRFARAWRAVMEPGIDPPASAVGLSRDLWPLVWSGRALLSLGKEDEARRAYRSALEMACRADPDPTAVPPFHREADGGRFGIPLEENIGMVVADLADRPEWSADDWEGLLPDFAGAWLVASRVLRQRGDPAADRALERAIALGDSPAPLGTSPAIHEAAVAEALALAGRFEEAADRYRGAVERLSKAEDQARRPWMFNLAELSARLDDPKGERAALLAAMVTDPNDPVTREAIRSQLRRGVGLVGGEGDGFEPDSDATSRQPRRWTFGE